LAALGLLIEDDLFHNEPKDLLAFDHARRIPQFGKILTILQEEKLAGRAAEIGACFLDALQSLKSHKNVGDIRGKGLLIGVELVKDRSSKEQLDPAQIGGVVDFCRDQGVIVARAGGGRRFGTTIALCPPLVITHAECDRIVETLGRALQALVID
jgi:taurine-pyruvate aminotransferase